MELEIAVDGAALPAILTTPEEPRAAFIALHGADAGRRDYFLYEHLAALLGALGIAVLRFDRRAVARGDVPLETQRDDAAAALRALDERMPGIPRGVWGYSQGAWAGALLAATRPELVDLLIVVSGSGVSPAEQMRFGCARQLRRGGYGEDDVREMLAARASVEDHLRTGRHPEETQAILDHVSTRKWFPLVYLSARLTAPGSWADMDFDPQPIFDRVRCPVLATFGEDDGWVPIDESAAAWERARRSGSAPDVAVARLARTDHLPTIGGVANRDAIADSYCDAVTSWLRGRLPGA